MGKKYKFAVIAVDVVIFTIFSNKLNVLLIKMKKKPYLGTWAVPGGLVRGDESVDQAAQRHLLTKTGVKNVYLEQLYTFGRVSRDPSGRVVSVAYFALIPFKGMRLKTTKEYAGVEWFPIDKLPRLAYDHREITSYAAERLKLKLERSNIIYSLLPNEFTLTELRKSYEIILGKKIDKRNFYKKIRSLNIIKSTQKIKRGESNRPAKLYTFISRTPKQVNVL